MQQGLNYLIDSLKLLSDFKTWIAGLALFPVFYFIADKVFPAVLKHYFDRRLEIFRRRLLSRDKAAIISELMILVFYRNMGDDENRIKANRLIFDLCLYLPPCLIHSMAHTIVANVNDPQNIGWGQLFVNIRGYIDGSYEAKKDSIFDQGNIPQYKIVADQAPKKTP